MKLLVKMIGSHRFTVSSTRGNCCESIRDCFSKWLSAIPSSVEDVPRTVFECTKFRDSSRHRKIQEIQFFLRILHRFETWKSSLGGNGTLLSLQILQVQLNPLSEKYLKASLDQDSWNEAALAFETKKESMWFIPMFLTRRLKLILLAASCMKSSNRLNQMVCCIGLR